jgi:hypothetical protein
MSLVSEYGAERALAEAGFRQGTALPQSPVQRSGDRVWADWGGSGVRKAASSL